MNAEFFWLRYVLRGEIIVEATEVHVVIDVVVEASAETWLVDCLIPCFKEDQYSEGLIQAKATC